jgi:hypothetical protein
MQTFFLKNIQKRKKIFKVDEIIERLRKMIGKKNQNQLAIELGISQSTISTWKKRNSIDIEKILDKCWGLDLNYLFYGDYKEVSYEQKPDENIYASEEKINITKTDIDSLVDKHKLEMFEKIFKELTGKDYKI